MRNFLTTEQLDTIARLVTAAHPEVEAVYLYGSAADGTLGSHSDIDIAVVLPPAVAHQAGPLALSDLRFRLEEELAKPVDLVNARTCPIVLQKEIIRGGIRILTADRTRAEVYEMLVLSLYGKLNEERRAILDDFYASRKA